MPDVTITIADRRFTLTCGEGEEEQLLHLGDMVDKTAREAGYAGQGLTESRLLLFTSLLLADQIDELHKSEHDTPSPAPSAGDKKSEMAASAVEKLADRMEKLAMALEEVAATS